jgi:hypothetical protein
MQFRWVSTYEFRAGRSVFLLRSPDGITWVMQTFTDRVDHGLTEAALPQPSGPRGLPGGWAYQTRKLDRDLSLTTAGLAHILPDDQANMYQGCVDGTANFDPWVPGSRRAVQRRSARCRRSTSAASGNVCLGQLSAHALSKCRSTAR